MHSVLRHSLVLLMVASLHTSAHAAWPSPPLGSLPVCTITGNQGDVAIVPDSEGGALIAWDDFRSGDCDIYVQHVLASGVVDPAWPADGRAIMVLGGYQLRPHIVTDGAGGVIVVWTDHRGASWDVYASHVLATGDVDPAWPVTGVALCSEVGDQNVSEVVSDAAGGAFVVWADPRSGEFDVYVHHVTAGGAVDPAIPANGLAVCALAGTRGGGAITSDGAGGALIAWLDRRSGPEYDVYATRLLASGVLDPAWPSGGRALCTAPLGQGNLDLVPDGAGGAIVAWVDYRSGFGDIYAQRVSGNGVVDPAWPLDGRALCTANGDQFGGLLVADGAGGAIVTWDDMRNSVHSDIYAQRVSGAGIVDPAWPAQGRALCAAPAGQYAPVPASDGAGGAIVLWLDIRSGRAQAYVQHVLASGTLDPGWDADGELVAQVNNDQIQPQLVPDGTGSAIFAWADFRNGVDYDVYAQRMTPTGGVLGVFSPRASARSNGAAADLEWQASECIGATTHIERNERGSGWVRVASGTGDGEGFVRFVDTSVRPGSEYVYRLGLVRGGQEVFAGEVHFAFPSSRLVIETVSPNPARGGQLAWRAKFAGPGSARARILDLAGRVVLERELAAPADGVSVLPLRDAALRPGRYLLELQQNGARSTASFTYLE